MPSPQPIRECQVTDKADEAKAAAYKVAELEAVCATKHAEFSALRASRWHDCCTLAHSEPLSALDDDIRAHEACKEADRARLAAGADLATKNVTAKARKAEFMHKKAAAHTSRLDAAAVETALSAKSWADADDGDIGTNDDFLVKYIRDTEHENPLSLNGEDILSIHRQFELYTETFPPGANGRHRFLVDAETWQTYCELQPQFSQFPLHFVDDERQLLAPEA